MIREILDYLVFEKFVMTNPLFLLVSKNQSKCQNLTLILLLFQKRLIFTPRNLSLIFITSAD